MTEQEIQENKTRFIALCKEKISRKGLEGLLDYLEKTDFYIAPTSTKFHLNEAGGLCKHSINVYETAVAINDSVIKPAIESGESPFSEAPSDESIAVAALFHDVCKVNLYHKEEKWKKDSSGRWVSYEGYTSNDTFPFGHGEKSCFFIERFIRLRPEELLAIRWHMGMFDMGENGTAMRKAFYSAMDLYPLVSLLQSADTIASKCREKTTIY